MYFIYNICIYIIQYIFQIACIMKYIYWNKNIYTFLYIYISSSLNWGFPVCMAGKKFLLSKDTDYRTWNTKVIRVSLPCNNFEARLPWNHIQSILTRIFCPLTGLPEPRISPPVALSLPWMSWSMAWVKLALPVLMISCIVTWMGDYSVASSPPSGYRESNRLTEKIVMRNT